MITNAESNTRVDEIADGIYRISTPVTNIPGGFSYNRYLVVDEAPLLFHSGPRGMFALTRDCSFALSLVGSDPGAEDELQTRMRAWLDHDDRSRWQPLPSS